MSPEASQKLHIGDKEVPGIINTYPISGDIHLQTPKTLPVASLNYTPVCLTF